MEKVCIKSKLANKVRLMFPPAKEYNIPGKTNPMCRLCGDWVVDNSSCSDRYHQMEGQWDCDNPFWEEEGFVDDIFEFCDKCYDKYTMNARNTIEIFGRIFHISRVYRMND